MFLLYVILTVCGLILAISVISWLIAWCSNYIEIFFAITAIDFIAIFMIKKRRKALLGKSEKFNTMIKLAKDLEPYNEPIELELKSFEQFNRYNKTVALDRAYGEIYSKYRFLYSNNFEERLKAVSNIKWSKSSYVKEKEQSLYETLNKNIHVPVKITWFCYCHEDNDDPVGRGYYSKSAYITREDLQEYMKIKKKSS